ncbi:MAG TPA: adenosylmethionine--8-amino-7-oxononanoate transaminase [Acidimicrobiales bacterium]|nr:adenosylmethionine--8-amino-7-oxononanoate transaminase [Acidimicrobiales bacterium]
MPEAPSAPSTNWTRNLRTDEPASLAARDGARVWHPYAPMPASLPPIPVAGARGTRLVLADGREVVDGMSSWWASIHGYRHPVLDDAVRAQLDATAHVMFGGLTHAPAVELAELLVAIAPAGLEHVFLADSGSVSVEVAIKMALQHARGTGRPGRTKLLTVRGGYHGDTLACMSVCDPVNGMHSMFADVLPAQLFAPVPSPGFGEPFDDSHVAELARLLHEHHDSVAAVILEPVVQGAGGMRFYAPEYLAAVRRLCDEHDVLLIADEIATGFGRTGRLFGCDHAGVTPDIMCVGKALTGGYLTMAAVLCTPEVAAGVSAAESGALMHGPTFMGNPLAAAVSLASVRLLLSRPWEDEVAGIEAGLRDGLAGLEHHDAVVDVRVLGAIGVVELREPVDMAASQATLLDHGVWLRPFGRLLYTMPPFVSSADDVAAITAAMRAVVGP